MKKSNDYCPLCAQSHCLICGGCQCRGVWGCKCKHTEIRKCITCGKFMKKDYDAYTGEFKGWICVKVSKAGGEWEHY